MIKDSFYEPYKNALDDVFKAFEQANEITLTDFEKRLIVYGLNVGSFTNEFITNQKTSDGIPMKMILN